MCQSSRCPVVASVASTVEMLAAVTGLAALLHTSALAFQIFKYLGVAYLLYMAWSTLRERGDDILRRLVARRGLV